MTDFEGATLAGQYAGILVSVFQAWLIFIGLRQMRAASRNRDQQHEETMRALDQQHEEAMTVLDKQHEQRNQQHEQAMVALHALIERTR